MKKVLLSFVMVISFFVIGCGTSPDHSREEIETFITGMGYEEVVRNLEIETTLFSIYSSQIKVEDTTTTIEFDNIVIAKDNNKKFLLFIKSDGSFPKITKCIELD